MTTPNPHLSLSVRAAIEAGDMKAVQAIVDQGADPAFFIKAACAQANIDLLLLNTMAERCSTTPFGRAQLFDAAFAALDQRRTDRALVCLTHLGRDHPGDSDRIGLMMETGILGGHKDIVAWCAACPHLTDKHFQDGVLAAVKAGSMEMLELMEARVTSHLSIHRLLDHSLHFGHPHLRDYFLARANDADKLYAAVQASAWQKWDDVVDMLGRCATFPDQDNVDILTLKAVEQGRVDVVTLLPASSHEEQSMLASRAIAHGQMEMFQLLLGRVQGNSKIPAMINLASSHRHWEMVLIMCQRLVAADKPIKHLQDTLVKTMISACGTKIDDDVLERLCAVYPNDALEAVVAKGSVNKPSPKIMAVKAHLDRRVLTNAVQISEDHGQKTRKM